MSRETGSLLPGRRREREKPHKSRLDAALGDITTSHKYQYITLILHLSQLPLVPHYVMLSIMEKQALFLYAEKNDKFEQCQIHMLVDIQYCFFFL